jgi:hypothetical protein
MLVILLLVVAINFKIMRISENKASGYHGPKDYSQVSFEEGLKWDTSLRKLHEMDILPPSS